MRVYQQFRKREYRADFLFCFEPNEYCKKFSLSKTRAEQQIKFQVRFLRFARFYHWYVLLFFGSFTIKMAAKSVALTESETQLYCVINLIKIVSSICFFLAFQGTTLDAVLFHYEIIASCQFLSNCLNDLTDQVLKLVSKQTDWKKPKNEKYLIKKIMGLSKSYGKLLTRQCQLDNQFGQSLHFMTVTLLFCLAYPAALIFDPDKDQRKAVLYSFNYLFLNLFFFTIVIFNAKFLNANQNFVKSLAFLAKFSKPSTSIKLLNIHQLNHVPTGHSFTYNRLFSFTSSFYFSVNVYFVYL